MNTNINRLITLACIVGLIILTALFLTQRASGSAPSGLPATFSTTTLGYVVGTTQSLLVATSSCSARVITTRAAPVMLTFTDVAGKVPTAVLGHLQTASTTVVYDSGQYGCEAVRVVSATGVADTITVSESR
jgi:hypothetical protein